MSQRRRLINQVRIIGGRHRGRRLPFPELPGLRPSGDRVRETLFNWLQASIAGASCLDLFAGSGALGLEAVSRGAARLVMVERERQAASQLRENLRLLQLEQSEVIQADGLQWLACREESFDLVFLDPPFADGLLAAAVQRLLSTEALRDGAWVYLESDARVGLPALPAGLRLEKEKRMGQVTFGLARFRAE